MFNLKSPCVNCPFKKGQGELFRLSPERFWGIVTAEAFQCHKTVDYDNGPLTEEGETVPVPGDKPNQCAGLMAVLSRSGKPNTIMQIASRLGRLDLDELDPRREAYGSIEEAFEAHTKENDNGPSKR